MVIQRQELVSKAALQYSKDGISPRRAILKAKKELEKEKKCIYTGNDLISIQELFSEISRINKQKNL